MSPYQIGRSVTFMFGIVVGLIALASELTTEFAPWAGITFCGLICLALAITHVIGRLPMEHEPGFRAAKFGRWRELSPVKRLMLKLFDHPLFYCIRNSEEGRLRNEPLIQINFGDDGFSADPIEETHRTRYFRRHIASYLAIHGLKPRRVRPAVRTRDGNETRGLHFSGGDEVILLYLRNKYENDELVSLSQLRFSIEIGYASTLPQKERHAYLMMIAK